MHGVDTTQGQLFFKQSTPGANSDFPSPRLIALQKLKNPVCSIILVGIRVAILFSSCGILNTKGTSCQYKDWNMF